MVKTILQGGPLQRGQIKSGLDPEAIYQQLYRPWLWSEHFSMFTSSPHWMGWGTFNFLDHVSYNLVPELDALVLKAFQPGSWLFTEFQLYVLQLI
jgi:hypothetical protein